MKRMIFCALLLPALALADPQTADDWYKEGETQYNLGNFDKAADAFKQGYSLETTESKKPAYLYNVAQAYRQGNKCKDAAFFYKRYLSLKDQDTAKPLAATKRTEIEQRITELEECAKNQEAIAKKPPDTLHPDGDGSGSAKIVPGTGSGSGSATVRVGTGSDEHDTGEDEGSGITKSTTTTAPKVLSARFTGGATKINAGGLDVPIEATFSLIAGYPVLVQDKLEVDVGGALSFTPVPFTNTITNANHTGSLTLVLADAGASYTVAPKIALRGDLGVGALLFGGIDEMGNPFTQNGNGTTGTLTMFAIRAGVSADYQITPNFIATVAPIAFTYSPAKAGLRDDIKSITRLDFMLGLGYRM